LNDCDLFAITIIVFFAFLTIGISFINLPHLQMCSITLEGELAGSFDVNAEEHEMFNKFNVRSIDGKMSITVPCKMLEEKFG